MTTVFILSLSPFLIVELFRSHLYIVMDVPSYLVFHNIAEFFSVMVSLSIGVGWFTYEQSKNRHALFLGSAFLAIGLMDFMHTLSYSGMPPFITANSANKSTQFWIAVRLFTAATFVAGAYVYAERPRRWLSKPALMTAAVAVPALVFTVVIFYPQFVPDTFKEGVGLTFFKKSSEYLIIVLLSLAAASYWRRFSKTGDRTLIFYVAAFIVCIFSELVFAVYRSVFDTYNVLGHVYKVAAFSLIYTGIFAASVKYPYLELADTSERLRLDIMERNRIEETLRSSEIRYRRLFESAKDGILILDVDTGLIVDANPFMIELLGYTREEYLEKKLWEIGLFGDVEACKAIFRELQATGYTRYAELPLQRHVSNSYEVDGNRAIQCNIRDITERRLAENALRRSEQLLRKVLETLPVGVWIQDSDGRIVSCNPAGQLIWGGARYVGMEQFGQYKGWRADTGKKIGAEEWAATRAIKKGETSLDEEIEIECFDGMHKIILNSAIPIRDDRQEIIGSIIVNQDISRQKHMELQLREYAENLEQKVRERTLELDNARRASDAANMAKSEFLANMSHELRTPLNSIIGFSEIMIDGLAGTVTDKQKEYLRDIWESGKHLLRLINDVLDLSKIEAGRMELELGEFPLHKLIEESVVMFREKALRHRIALSTDVSVDIGMITADERKLKQVLFNLLGNAFKFTPDDGRVGVGALKKDGEVQITVWDTGIGIAEKDGKSLFQPFQQLDTKLTKKYEGTGLGLYLCKKIVELHGGRIWCESEVGRGTRFTFTIDERRVVDRSVQTV